jgi:hypothetical protein
MMKPPDTLTTRMDPMRTLLKSLTILLCIVFFGGNAAAQGQFVDVGVNTEKTVTTVRGLAGLPSSLGSAEDYRVVLRIAPLRPGMKYEATLTYDAGSDIGYSHAWVDGSPYEQDWASFVGIGTGTGTRELRGKQENSSSPSTGRALQIRSTWPSAPTSRLPSGSA